MGPIRQSPLQVTRHKDMVLEGCLVHGLQRVPIAPSLKSWHGGTGEKELRKAASGPDPPMRIEWSENCVHQHDGWQVMFWDMAAALQLLREEYPWFLDTFQGYKRRVQQGLLSTAVS